MERKVVGAWGNAAAHLISGGGEESADSGDHRPLVRVLSKRKSAGLHAAPAETSPRSRHGGFSIAFGTMTLCALTACGTPPAKDFSGSWRPLNRFHSQATEIPLQQAYAFYAAPMDETLKTMLSRWAKDTGRTLDYGLDYDVTLYKPVADIRTTDIDSAVQQLSTIFAAQHVLVTAHPREIVVLATTAGANDRHAELTAAPAKPGARP